MIDCSLSFKKLMYEDGFITKESLIAYEDELERNAEKINPTLLRFFGSNFFHDGEVRNLRMEDSSLMRFDISCPNIAIKYDGGFKYLAPIWFKCEISGIEYLSLQLTPPANQNAGLTFNISELNTLNLKSKNNKLKSKNKINSIIIEFFTGRLGISFENIIIEALEPLAFDLICMDQRYVVPIFDIEKMRRVN